MRRGARTIVAAMLAVLPPIGCDEENPFRNQPENVTSGESQVWELDLAGFPSGFDFAAGQRFFLQSEIGPGRSGGILVGDWFLDARPGGALVFAGMSSLAPSLTISRTGIQDLGPVSFGTLEEVPEGGYTPSDDAAGVPVVEGHVYAFRVSTAQLGFVPVNYAKLEALEVGLEDPADPGSRFVRFRWSYQEQPLNRRVVEE